MKPSTIASVGVRGASMNGLVALTKKIIHNHMNETGKGNQGRWRNTHKQPNQRSKECLLVLMFLKGMMRQPKVTAATLEFPIHCL